MSRKDQTSIMSGRYADVMGSAETPDLLEDHLRFKRVVESLPIALFSIEAFTNRLLYVAGDTFRTFGYTHQEFYDDPDIRIRMVHPDDQDYVDERFRAGLESMEPFDLECRILNPLADRTMWIYIRSVPITDEGGRLLRQDCIVLDITPRKLLEQEQSQMQAQLMRAQKLESLGVLAGGIAHDFNNLLTIIIGNAQFIRDNPNLTGEQTAALDDLETAACHASEMTKSLQAFSRPASPKSGIIDLHELIRRVHRLLRRMIPMTIDFALDVEPGECHITADSGQIQQIIVNLCINARDAMPNGGSLTISAARMKWSDLPEVIRPDPVSKHCARICVTDTGCGMDEEVLARVFDPYFTTKPVDYGTGLGLAVAYKIVRAHHGVIDIVSKPGAGTTVTLTFPACEPDAMAAPDAPPQTARGERILVVEDEEMVAGLLKTALESRGYLVTHTAQPADALSLLADGRRPVIDLMLVDYDLPSMTGDRLLAIAREQHPTLKAILMTGHYLSRDNLCIGNCRLLQKPFSLRTVAEMVGNALDED